MATARLELSQEAGADVAGEGTLLKPVCPEAEKPPAMGECGASGGPKIPGSSVENLSGQSLGVGKPEGCW